MEASIRPFRPGDLPGVLGVLSAALPADPVPAPRFVRQVLLDPNFEPDGALVARVDGEVAGFALAIARRVPLENAPPDDDRGYVTLIAVRPGFQGRGLGSQLLERAEAYLRARGRSRVVVSPYAPGYFLPGVDVRAYEPALRFFLKRGYRELHRPVAMAASLWDLAPPGWLAERRAALAAAGTRIEPYALEHTLPLLEFARAEFPGDWVRVVREAMARIAAGEAGPAAPRLFLAVEGAGEGRVLGFVHTEGERFGPIGVAAAARGRALGHLLMFEALAAMRESGLRTAWFLWSDDATARRLYDAAGFREVRRFALLRKELE